VIDIRFTRGAATIRSGATATLVLPLAPARSTVVHLVDDAGLRWSGDPLEWSRGGTFEVRLDAGDPIMLRLHEPASG